MWCFVDVNKLYSGKDFRFLIFICLLTFISTTIAWSRRSPVSVFRQLFGRTSWEICCILSEKLFRVQLSYIIILQDLLEFKGLHSRKLKTNIYSLMLWQNTMLHTYFSLFIANNKWLCQLSFDYEKYIGSWIVLAFFISEYT